MRRTIHRRGRWRPLFAAAAVASLVPAASLAVPACPEPVRLKQPDGREVRVHLRGDEFFHWHEDDRGYTILREPGTKRWVYAQRGVKGELQPGRSAVGDIDPTTLKIEPRALPTGASAQVEAARSARAPADGNITLAAPLTGTMMNLVVLVEFSDLAGARPVAEFDALFNTVGYTADSAAGSVRDYYDEVSYDALTVQSVIADWVTLDHRYAFYGANDVSGNDRRPREMVAEALAKLEARGFDFSGLDANNDGWVDGLTIIHAGGGEEYGGNDTDYIWSHKWTLTSTVTYDGKSMNPYHTESARRGWDSTPSSQGITRIGVIAHETGHFLGLPDLYDYGGDSQGVGDFCLMAGGSWNGDNGTHPAHMSAWCKEELGWVTPTLVSSAGTFTVPRVEDNQVIYRLNGNLGGAEYFLIENRQGYGFDAGLPGSNRGLLIWHVDEDQPNNDDQTHFKVDLEEASGTQHLEQNTDSGDDADYFRQGNTTTFSAATTPNNQGYDGTPLGLDIASVSASGNSMTFDIGALPATNTLEIISAYGMASPAVGIYEYLAGTEVTCAITNSPVMVYEATRLSQVVCTGWVGSGSAPASGTTLDTGPFPLNGDASVTWLWAVSNLWLSNQVVTTTITEEALDTISAGDGYVVDPSGDATFEAGATIRLAPGFTASSGSVFRAVIEP